MIRLPEEQPLQKVCHILGAGPLYGYVPDVRKGDLLVAADGGVRYCREFGLAPDHIIGDFDSLGFVPEDDNVTVLPVIKDDTDTLSCLEYGLEKGFRTFLIYGGTGGRIDHTVANLQHLAYLSEKGARGYLLSEKNIITLIKNEEVSFRKDAKGFLSVFSFGDRALGVTIRGMKYQVEGATLTNTYPLGVSNEFTGNRAEVSVSEGKLLLVYERDASK